MSQPILRNMPQISVWWERIDKDAWAVHAVRNWDIPSNGEFKLVADRDRRGWGDRTLHEVDAVEKLKERERILYNFYGRAWRHHMLDEINWDDKQPANPR